MTIQKLSWVCIEDRKVLFVRSPEGDVFFDPGCRRIPGRDDQLVLAEKIKQELGVTLEIPMMKMHSFSFSTQAYGKPEGEMVEMYPYMARSFGRPTTSEFIAELDFFTSADMERTSDAGKALLQRLKMEGLIR